MKAIPIILMAGLALGALIAVYLGERHRAAAIRTLATRLGFHYLGNALPKSLTLHGTPFGHASKVWNVIDGEPHGVRTIGFDCRVGIGKGRWRRTVIAVESNADFWGAVRLNREMAIDSAGKWKVLYRPRASINFRIAGLMPPEELESYLNSVAADALKSSHRGRWRFITNYLPVVFMERMIVRIGR